VRPGSTVRKGGAFSVYMINPNDVTKFDRTTAELEEFLLFCIFVAGKNAATQAAKLSQFLGACDELHKTPFGYIRWKDEMPDELGSWAMYCGLGQYTRIVGCLRALVQAEPALDLRTCSTDDLERIYGIGPKTSRFFVLHSRPDQQIAVLDTHILKWLRDQGEHAPKRTPTGAMYQKLEQVFLAKARSMNKTSAELDLEIWRELRSG
jgi:thermostable 8-oxoguanine DNA glycosylase